ncbi:serine/threonine-protein kinase [Spirillospora sp. CA-253888]
MANPAALLPGDPRHLGPYSLAGRLGDGAQGTVYLGKGPDGRQVAVKLLHARFGADAEARARFGREVSVIQRVAGFCTAQVLAADVSGDRPYIVSEYVTGPSLEQLVRARGPRTGTDLDRLAIGTATALTAIHRAGIVHRDFKPANVLMAQDGPRVIDFGIARALDSGATMASGVVGTPAFMAPEQVAGAAVDKPVDVFSWGATMVFAATGASPFGHDTVPAVFNRILNHRPDLSRLPAGLREIVAACLAKDPAHRPTAQQLLLRLLGEETGADQALAQGRSKAQQGWAAPPPPVHGRPAAPQIAHGAPAYRASPGAFPPVPRTIPSTPPARKRPRTGLAVAAAAGALVLVVGGAGAVWMLGGDGADGKPKPPAAPAADGLEPPAEAVRLQTEAAAFLPRMLDYDHRTMDADIARANAGMTQRAQARYDANLDAIRTDLTGRKGAIKATVVDSGVLAHAQGRASILALVKRVTTSTKAPVTSMDQIRYTLVRQPDGAWLVDELDALVPQLSPWSYEGTAWPSQTAGAVLSAARACVTKVQTYGHRTFPDDIRQLLECSTGEYRTQVQNNQAKVQADITKTRSVSTGTALEAALKPGARPDQATVLVSVSVTVTGTKPGRVVYSYWADMRRTDGRWLLAKLDPLQ